MTSSIGSYVFRLRPHAVHAASTACTRGALRPIQSSNMANTADLSKLNSGACAAQIGAGFANLHNMRLMWGIAVVLLLAAPAGAQDLSAPGGVGPGLGASTASYQDQGGIIGGRAGHPRIQPARPGVRRTPSTPSFGLPGGRRTTPGMEAMPFALDAPLTPEDEGPLNGLTLDQAIEQLKYNSLSLRAKQLEIPQARADELTASLRVNPFVFADGQLIPYRRYSSTTNPGGPTQYDINITYPFDLSGKRMARMEVAAQARCADRGPISGRGSPGVGHPVHGLHRCSLGPRDGALCRGGHCRRAASDRHAGKEGERHRGREAAGRPHRNSSRRAGTGPTRRRGEPGQRQANVGDDPQPAARGITNVGAARLAARPGAPTTGDGRASANGIGRATGRRRISLKRLPGHRRREIGQGEPIPRRVRAVSALHVSGQLAVSVTQFAFLGLGRHGYCADLRSKPGKYPSRRRERRPKPAGIAGDRTPGLCRGRGRARNTRFPGR